MKRKWGVLAALLALLPGLLSGCGGISQTLDAGDGTQAAIVQTQQDDGLEALKENGTYTSKEDVADYIHEYGHLPGNYITKEQAKKLGWVSAEGNLDEVAPGKSIGGDRFGNYEGLLPEGREYYECDVNTDGGDRGAERIVYSTDGLIYYTGDHYETFDLLYGEEDK